MSTFWGERAAKGSTHVHDSRPPLAPMFVIPDQIGSLAGIELT